MLQACNTREDIAAAYDLNADNMRLATNRESTWYMIYEEREKELYIADLAMLNGANSENKGEKQTNIRLSTYEAAVTTYEVMLEVGRKGKCVKTEATRDTSLLNLNKMQEKGLIKIAQSSDFNDGVDKSKVEFVVDVEKMEKELETIKVYLDKIRQRERLKGVNTDKTER